MKMGAPQTGDVLGSYEVVEELGRGGLGVVFRARHVHLGREVALKVLHPYWTASPEFVQRFREEGRLMALLDHANILRVYDAGEQEGVFFLAMNLLDGQVLEELLGSPLPIDVVLHVARQLALALQYAHKAGVVHRDVKPANIMISSRGNVTLMDFGVARLRDAPGMTLPGVRVGTPYYMAPEQILGKKVDQRADLYSVGVILYQMLSGALPFPGPTTEEVYEGHVNQLPPDLADETPGWLGRVIRKLLAKEVDSRLTSAAALLRALDSRGDELVLKELGVPDDPAWTSASAEEGPARQSPTKNTVAAGPRDTALTRQERTALSLDVVGSSRMKNPGLTLAAQEQFSEFRLYVREHLQRHSAVDSLWSGDGLLALFVRPAQGAACAAGLLSGLARFNEQRAKEWAPIRLRIGVHHGPILLAPGQPLGEVTSRTLDLAGHLQKTCPENSALISEAVYFALHDNRGWRPAGDEYLLVFPFRLYQCEPASAAAGASAPGSSAPAGRPPNLEDIPLDLRLARAVADEPGILELEVATGKLRRLHRIRDVAMVGRPDSAAGYAPEIDVSQDDAVSRKHARFARCAAGFQVEDLGSANGTRLNGAWLEPGAPQPIHEGDVVEVGEVTVIRVISLGRESPSIPG